MSQGRALAGLFSQVWDTCLRGYPTEEQVWQRFSFMFVSFGGWCLSHPDAETPKQSIRFFFLFVKKEIVFILEAEMGKWSFQLLVSLNELNWYHS